jgi:negative regulator of sigma E activity
MNEASRLLDGELTEAELGTLLERLKHDAALRDAVSAQQWMRDSLVGLRSLDDGHTLRILARLPRERGGGN